MSENWCDDIVGAISSQYELAEPITCRFLRHGFNEHFRAIAGDTEVHVRVYLDGKYYIRDENDFRCELAFAAALAEAGCPVAAPIPRRDGEFLSTVDIDGQERRLALFVVAPGDVKAQPTLDDAAAIGRAVAMIHATADTVATALPGGRYHLDERYLLHQPIDQLRRAAPEASQLPRIESLVAELALLLESLPKDSSDYGLIHADFHLGNMHFTDDGRLTIFDFDHGAHGWRAYDFAPLRMSLSDENWSAALDAYASCRQLPIGIEHIADLVKIRTLWDLGDILAMEGVWGNDDASRQIRDALPRICERLGIT